MNKRSIFFSIIIVICAGFNSYAQVGINTSSPKTNTLLHVSELNSGTTTYKGVLLPTYTTAQRDANFPALAATDNGLLIYNTTHNCYNYYKHPAGAASGQWINMCNPDAPKSGIVASYIGAPVIIKSPSNAEFPNSGGMLASSRTPAKYKLAKDDIIQLDFGQSNYPGTVQIYMRNISTESVTISYSTSTSNGAGLDPIITGNFTLAAGQLSSTLDPYNSGIGPNSYGYSSTWDEADGINFTLTTSTGEVRYYMAVWTSIGSKEAGSGGAALRTELHQYIP